MALSISICRGLNGKIALRSVQRKLTTQAGHVAERAQPKSGGSGYADLSELRQFPRRRIPCGMLQDSDCLDKRFED